MNRISDDMLTRFVDGELDPESHAELTRVLLQDREQLGEARRLADERHRLKSAFEPEANPALAADLAGMISTADRNETVEVQARSLPVWAMPLAASFLTALVVGAGSLAWMENRLDQMTIAFRESLAQDSELMRQTIHEALHDRPSGQFVSWQNPRTGSTGLVRPVRTFKNRLGEWCREYERTLVQGGQMQQGVGLACLRDGRWQISFEKPSSGPAGGETL